jgi:peptidoglycan/xylan/chitin deacetylase (PgdA/CDA1 family)
MCKVTLTFDNGPTPGVTDAVLDMLAERAIPATFFVVGTQLRQPGGRELVRRARAEGHRIGHHTTTHTLQLGGAEDPEAAVQSEIADLAAELEEFDDDEKLFRPYAAGGVLDQRVFSQAALRYLEAHAYTCVLWNSLPRDWENPLGWVAHALHDVDRHPWTVVVLHDARTGAMAQLPRFLDELADRRVEMAADYPASCLPIRAGHAVGPLSHLTREPVP